MSDTEDDALFRSLMRDVKPLKKRKTITPTIKKSAITPKNIIIEPLTPATQDNLDQERHSLTRKQRPYKPFQPGVSIHYSEDLHEPITSESVLQYQMDHLAPEHQQKLKKGQIKIDSRIDLHGVERFEAQDRLHRYLEHAKSHGLRNLLIIHGKGSKHGEAPILKTHLYLWLRHYPAILAMHSAHAKHGGTGALYVLLKKAQKQKNHAK